MDRAIDLPALIAALTRSDAYPHATGEIVVHQTHISVVFLAGEYAYKIKKPVKLDFLDFSTLDKRKYFCEEEVRLNRRLAPSVYLGVVPIAGSPLPSGGEGLRGLRVGGPGAAMEWAVRMKRLPEEATLESRLLRDEVSAADIDALAQRIAAFHRAAEHGPRIASFGRFDVVAQNARDNFAQTVAQVGTTISKADHERLRELTEAHLQRHRSLIEARATQNIPCDTHGDLHLDHVYWLPEGPTIIDCIEFADRFRYADPVADMAFLVMDLELHGRHDLAEVFAAAYFAAANDAQGRLLLPFYAAYRAVVRAKVDGIKVNEREIDEAARADALERARAYWRLALRLLLI